MNPLGGTLICILHIIFQVLPPRLQGDCHPSSRVSTAVVCAKWRQWPHRLLHLRGLREAREMGRDLCGGPAPPHSPQVVLAELSPPVDIHTQRYSCGIESIDIAVKLEDVRCPLTFGQSLDYVIVCDWFLFVSWQGNTLINKMEGQSASPSRFRCVKLIFAFWYIWHLVVPLTFMAKY